MLARQRNSADSLRLGELFQPRAEHAIRPRFRFSEHLPAVGNQQPCAGPGLAGAHVLGKHEDFAARALDDQIQVAANRQRGRFEIAAARRDGHHAGLIPLEGRLDDRLEFLMRAVAGDRELAGLVRVDQADVELLDARRAVHLAEVSLHVDAVRPDRHRLDVPRGQPQAGRLVGAKHALRGQRDVLFGQPGDRMPGIRRLAALFGFSIRIDGLLELAQVLFKRLGDAELAPVGLRRARVFRHQATPSGDRLVEFLFRVEHFAEEKQNLGASVIERVVRQKLREAFPGLRQLPLPVLLDALEVFRIDHRLLDPAPPFVGGMLHEKSAPDGQRLVESRLRLVAAAEQFERLRNLAASGQSLVAEKTLQPIRGVGETPLMESALGNQQPRLGGQWVFRKPGQKRFQGRNAQVQLGCVCRLRNAPGFRQPECGLGDPRGVRLAALGEQVFPSPASFRPALGCQLALAQPVPGFDQQSVAGMLLGESGKPLDGRGEIAQFLATASRLQLDLGPLPRF